MAETYEISVTLNKFNGIIADNGDGTYNVTYANLTNGQIEAIGNAIKTAIQTSLKEVALSGEYDDLNIKPGIPSGYTQTSNFSNVAFSGSYNDLNNKPIDIEGQRQNFAKIAFTGEYSDLGHPLTIENVTNQVLTEISSQLGKYAYSEELDFNDITNINTKYIIDFTNYISDNPSSEELKLNTLCDSNDYIIGFKNLKYENIFLYSLLLDLADNYYSSLYKIKFYNLNNNYNIIDIKKIETNNTDEFYIKVDFESNIIDNFNIYIGTNFDASVAAQELDNLTISKTYGYLIFDYKNDVIYCKIKE